MFLSEEGRRWLCVLLLLRLLVFVPAHYNKYDPYTQSHNTEGFQLFILLLKAQHRIHSVLLQCFPFSSGSLSLVMMQLRKNGVKLLFFFKLFNLN